MILLGDFNDEVEEKKMSKFMTVCKLKDLVKQKKIVLKTLKTLIITSSLQSFQNSGVFETGL